MLFRAFAGPAYPITTEIANIINPNVLSTALMHPANRLEVLNVWPPNVKRYIPAKVQQVAYIINESSDSSKAE